MFGRWSRLAGSTAATLLTLAGGAAAQSVCGVSATGADPNTGGGATALGANAFACGPGAVAISGGTSIGDGAGASPDLGNGANIAVGFSAGQRVTGKFNTASGFMAGQDVKGNGNTASGVTAGQIVKGDNNVASGSNAGVVVTGNDNIASGSDAGSFVTGDDNVASGHYAGAFVTGDSNTASGAFAGQYVTGSDNIALGHNAGRGVFGTPLTMNDSISIGTDSKAGFDNSVAIGAGVATTRAGQVAIGDANATYTLAGVNSAGSKAAQSGSTYMVSTDASGNLASSTVTVQAVENTVTTVNAHSTQITGLQGNVATNTSNIAALDSRVIGNTNNIASLDNRVGSLESSFGEIDGRIDRAFEGTAMALAMVGGGLPSDKDFAVSLNWGTFEGENAFAGTAQARINDNLFIHGGLGVGASRGTVGGRAGVTYAW